MHAVLGGWASAENATSSDAYVDRDTEPTGQYREPRSAGGSTVIETVHRKQLRPVIDEGAELTDRVCGARPASTLAPGSIDLARLRNAGS